MEFIKANALLAVPIVFVLAFLLIWRTWGLISDIAQWAENAAFHLIEAAVENPGRTFVSLTFAGVMAILAVVVIR